MAQEEYKIGKFGPDLGLKLNRNIAVVDDAIDGVAEAVDCASLERKSEATTAETDVQEMKRLLQAILMGIEIIADQDVGSLIQNID